MSRLESIAGVRYGIASRQRQSRYGHGPREAARYSSMKFMILMQRHRIRRYAITMKLCQDSDITHNKYESPNLLRDLT